MKKLAFGYKCEQCGRGLVQERVLHHFQTKLRGLPLTVDEAHIGVCEECGARYFDPNETDRWRSLLTAQYAEKYLQPTDIRELQHVLGLSREQFATLLGCTRQSLYNWERPNRTVPQSRMADLFMRLVRESYRVGNVDVLRFLTQEAGKLGFDLNVAQQNRVNVSIMTTTRRGQRKQPSIGRAGPVALAADSGSVQEEVILEKLDGEEFGKLVKDFSKGTLEVEFFSEVPFETFDAEIWFKDGTQLSSNQAVVQNSKAVLLEQTKRRKDDVDKIVFVG